MRYSRLKSVSCKHKYLQKSLPKRFYGVLMFRRSTAPKALYERSVKPPDGKRSIVYYRSGFVVLATLYNPKNTTEYVVFFHANCYSFCIWRNNISIQLSCSFYFCCLLWCFFWQIHLLYRCSWRQFRSFSCTHCCISHASIFYSVCFQNSSPYGRRWWQWHSLQSPRYCSWWVLSNNLPVVIFC